MRPSQSSYRPNSHHLTKPRTEPKWHKRLEARSTPKKIMAIMLYLSLSSCELTPEKTYSTQTHDTGFTNTTLATLADKEESSDESSSSSDLWQRIRDGYQLPSLKFLSENLGLTQQKTLKQRVEPIVDRYKAHPSSLLKQMNNARWYLHYIVEELNKRNMPTELALLPFVESGFDPFAYSSGRASGLWQFIPVTAKRFSLDNNWWLDERRDIEASTQAAIAYLSYLHGHLENDWLLALAAYNAGEGTVGRAVKRNKKAGKPTDFWSLPLPKETRFYVPKLLAWAEIIRHPAQYQLALPTLPNTPQFSAVDVGSQIDLAKMADIANIDINTLYQLNPAYNRWATDPHPPHQLLIPYNKAVTVNVALKKHPIDERISWQRHTIKANESLGVIAQKYKTTVKNIKQANQLSSSVIRASKTLLIPIASKKSSYYSSSQQQRLATHQNKHGSSKVNKQKINYQVKAGDTLWAISKEFNVSTHRIARWNNMSPKDVLRNKQSLVLWIKKGATYSEKTSEAIARKTQRKVIYKVKRGDNLSNISNRFNVSVNDIRHWNSLDQKYLQPNQLLRLFVDIADTRRPF